MENGKLFRTTLKAFGSFSRLAWPAPVIKQIRKVDAAARVNYTIESQSCPAQKYSDLKLKDVKIYHAV